MTLRWDPESLRQRINRCAPYAGARIEVTHIADDASEIRARMPLEVSNTSRSGRAANSSRSGQGKDSTH